eukprot:jgi/Tetstr1/465445/TSEL_010129.t1
MPQNAGIIFIGHIETPWKTTQDCPRNGRGSDAVCRVHLRPAFREGLASVETCSHLYLLYWMHQARRDLVVQAPSFAARPHGCFALRSPIRPNPVALSVVELPYFAGTDSVPQARVGWREEEESLGARLTVYSREQIVARVLAGQKAAEGRRCLRRFLRTVRKWLARFRAGGAAALSNRASSPARVAGRLPDRLVALALHLRRDLRLTGRRSRPGWVSRARP